MIATLIDFLKDVYAKHGYVAVLVSLAVLVALALVVAKVGGVDLSAIAAWLGSVGG